MEGRGLLQPIKLTAAANNSLIKQAPVAAPLPPPRLPCSTLMSFPDLIQTENPPSNKQLQVVNRVKSGVSPPPREEQDGEGLRCVLFFFSSPPGAENNQGC